MANGYRLERSAMPNDPFERLNAAGQAQVRNAAALFEGRVDTPDTPKPSEGERLALHRAMARFLIDSGLASARGYV